MKVKILHEDNQIIVVEKPQGMLSQSDVTGDLDLLSYLKSYLKEKYNKPGNVYLGLVHRLDRPVGGVMVFARTSKAAARLSEQIREHIWTKTYLAVIHSNTSSLDREKLVASISKSSENISKIVHGEDPNAKTAELSLQKLDYKDKLMLVKINLKTGRSHQIRVQLSDMGKPIYGDMKYGRQEKGNIALWCSQITILHPTLKNPLEFSSLLPKEFPWNLFQIK